MPSYSEKSVTDLYRRRSQVPLIELFEQVEYAPIIQFIQETNLSHPLIVDIGAGTGMFGQFLLNRGVIISPDYYIGLELSKELISVGKELFPSIILTQKDILESGIEVLTIPNSIIVAIGVFESQVVAEHIVKLINFAGGQGVLGSKFIFTVSRRSSVKSYILTALSRANYYQAKFKIYPVFYISNKFLYKVARKLGDGHWAMYPLVKCYISINKVLCLLNNLGINLVLPRTELVSIEFSKSL